MRSSLDLIRGIILIYPKQFYMNELRVKYFIKGLISKMIFIFVEMCQFDTHLKKGVNRVLIFERVSQLNHFQTNY